MLFRVLQLVRDNSLTLKTLGSALPPAAGVEGSGWEGISPFPMPPHGMTSDRASSPMLTPSGLAHLQLLAIRASSSVLLGEVQGLSPKYCSWQGAGPSLLLLHL